VSYIKARPSQSPAANGNRRQKRLSQSPEKKNDYPQNVSRETFIAWVMNITINADLIEKIQL